MGVEPSPCSNPFYTDNILFIFRILEYNIFQFKKRSRCYRNSPQLLFSNDVDLMLLFVITEL